LEAYTTFDNASDCFSVYTVQEFKDNKINKNKNRVFILYIYPLLNKYLHLI
jgi:hypothetical protein